MLKAASLAEQQGESPLIIVVALLHDIGHFTSEFGMFTVADTEDRLHESTGARVLERFFPAAVIDCVQHHVAAKRYLCATDPAYASELSAASVHSLSLQGGLMTATEVQVLGQHPNLDAILTVRRLDNAGKVAGFRTPVFAHFAPRVQAAVDAHTRQPTRKDGQG